MPFEGATFSHYRVLHAIGKGGMGEVYLLEDQRVQRQVAGKFIRLDILQGEPRAAERALRLFWREATALAQLDSPAILPLYDHGEVTLSGVDVAYLIMPYRPAGSLKDWLQRRARARQPLSLAQIAHLVEQAAQALQHAHDHGIMHLDVKPGNFLIRANQAQPRRAQGAALHSQGSRREGDVSNIGRNDDAYPDLLLSDFGIARLVSASAHTSQQVRGTPLYTAPEQWSGHAVFASDQYALAIMAYELLAGRPPFRGLPMSVMYAHTHKQPPNICAANPQLPASVDAVLQRALAKHPDDRYPSVSAFARALRDALEEVEIDDGVAWRSADIQPSRAQSSNRPTRARTILLILCALCIILGAGSLGLYRLTHNQTQTPGYTPASLTASQQPASTTTSSPAARTTATAQPAPNVPGTTWHIQTNPAAAQNGIQPYLYNVAWADDRFIAVGGSGTVLTSFDGIKWNAQTLTTPQILYGVAWSGKRFVIVGTGGTIFSSLDGITWNPQNSNSLQDLYGIVWAGKHFVVVGQSGTILTSTDGVTWSKQNSGTTQSLQAIAWSGKLLVAVGTFDTIVTSSDIINWTIRNTGIPLSLYGIAWSQKSFVVVGTSNTTLVSSDGITWNAKTSGVQQDLHSIVWTGADFVIVGTNGTVLTSPDGTAWTQQQANTAQILYGVAWSGTRLVAVGQFGIILNSP